VPEPRSYNTPSFFRSIGYGAGLTTLRTNQSSSNQVHDPATPSLQHPQNPHHFLAVSIPLVTFTLNRDKAASEYHHTRPRLSADLHIRPSIRPRRQTSGSADRRVFIRHLQVSASISLSSIIKAICVCCPTSAMLVSVI
jgi:hypothetical protein